jgi:hypothetical protein
MQKQNSENDTLDFYSGGILISGSRDWGKHAGAGRIFSFEDN